MNQTMNKAQHNYLTARARLDVLEAQQKQMERDYIAAHGIVNPDGGTPERIYCIDDEVVFEKANEEFSTQVAVCDLEAEYNAARATLKEAEEKVIEYGFSLVPVGIRGTLEQGMRTRHTIRQQLLDLVLRLDVSTVPDQAKPQRGKGDTHHV